MRAIEWYLFASMFVAGAQAQQAVTSQPTQTQQTPVTPCATSPQSNQPSSSLRKKWNKVLNDKAAALGAKTGIPMPTTEDVSDFVSTKPGPCPPKPAVPAAAAAPAQAAPLKLPPDTFVSLHCNPMTPSPQGGSRQTTLTLPDPKDFAVPKATDFLADSVVPDTAAKTACYLIKVDPKTGKSFIQQ